MVNVKNRPEKNCPTCGTHFKCGRPDQIFCSRKCVRGGGKHHPICPCGVQTDSYMKKYCSTEHRVLYGNKKAPVVMVEHLCLGCGNTFTRPHYYPGKKKFCSNKCAHREQKMTTEVGALVSNDRTIIFRSGWEIRFWACCARFDIPIRSYDGPDIETSQGVYRPDFIITDPANGKVRTMEVKGWLRPEARDKIREAQCLGYRIFVLSKQQLLRLETGDKLDAHRMLMWGYVTASA